MFHRPQKKCAPSTLWVRMYQGVHPISARLKAGRSNDGHIPDNMSANAQKVQYPGYSDSPDDEQGESSPVRRILLVDEQAHVLRVIRLNLDRHGYAVDTALNSENALLLIKKHHYDVLIMTSDMPDMSIRQLCDNAARNCHTSMPLILVNDARDDDWIDGSSVVERLGTPVSLRWIVARLDDMFGGDE